MKQLSIIIPVYNAERWLHRCVNSIVHSDLNKAEIEIIMINDGSTDNSKTIAEQYAEDFKYIRVINQENKGASEARNTGIKNAVGKYLWLIDSDDFVDSHLSDMLGEVIKIDADCYLTYISYYKEGYISEGPNIYQTLPKGIVISGRDAILNRIIPSSACIIIFRRQFMIDHELLYDPNYIHEDVVLTFTCFCMAKKIYISEFAKYICEKRKDSISNPDDIEKRIQFVRDDLKVSEYFKQFAEKYADDKPVHKKILCLSASIKNGLLSSIVLGHAYQKLTKSVTKGMVKSLWEEGYFPMTGPFYNWRQCLYINYANAVWAIKKLTNK